MNVIFYFIILCVFAKIAIYAILIAIVGATIAIVAKFLVSVVF